MIFIVDTNILFSFFRDNPVRTIIVNSPFFGLRLVTPEFAIDELEKIKPNLLKYTKLKENELYEILSALKQCIEVVPLDFFKDYKEKGKICSPDPKDAPFFSLALKLQGNIWSNEPRLKKQNFLKVYSTPDLIQWLESERK